MSALPLRIPPLSIRSGGRARYLVERNLLVYRRIWPVVFSGFFEPLFYLFGVGVGIGQLVGDVTGPGGQPVTYAAFVAPGLLAASAMNGAIYESTMNIFFKLKYGKVYEAILATPVGPRDIAVGEIMWCQARGALYATGFLVVVAALGLLPAGLWMGLLALPAAVLIGFAFGAVGMAATTFMRSWQDFDLVQMVILPLFLFSTTFFPLDVYPPAIQPLLQLSPLYHGVALLRSLTLGSFGVAMLGHIAFLLAMAAVGVAIAGRRIERLLLT
ncbi:MAG: ABC transporter permease [Actinomycetota bacterium]|nr:ABC transporter permease [Actinomycetota bacterium]